MAKKTSKKTPQKLIVLNEYTNEFFIVSSYEEAAEEIRGWLEDGTSFDNIRVIQDWTTLSVEVGFNITIRDKTEKSNGN